MNGMFVSRVAVVERREELGRRLDLDHVARPQRPFTRRIRSAHWISYSSCR